MADATVADTTATEPKAAVVPEVAPVATPVEAVPVSTPKIAIAEVEKIAEDVVHEVENLFHEAVSAVPTYFGQPVKGGLHPLAVQSPESYAAQHVAT